MTTNEIGKNTAKFQVNGLFETKAENWTECLEVLKKCFEMGLKAI